MSVGPIGEGSPVPLSIPSSELGIATPLESPGQGDVVSSLGKSFLELVQEASAHSHDANRMAKDLAEGRSDDIHGTMIELSKASIETRLAVNVKDKIIDAFYEIWRMSI